MTVWVGCSGEAESIGPYEKWLKDIGGEITTQASLISVATFRHPRIC
jgi:hypothetical protein